MEKCLSDPPAGVRGGMNERDHVALVSAFRLRHHPAEGGNFLDQKMSQEERACEAAEGKD